MAAESKSRVILTAMAICLACSVVVSTAAVMLRPVQESARLADKKRNILEVVGLYAPGTNVDEAFAQVTPRVVELETGAFTDAVDPQTYDQYAAAKTAEFGTPIPAAEDKASVRFKPKYATVYFVYDEDGSVRNVILPVSGYGLWSTLYGFLALQGDGNTVHGINFYQHAETPGLGGEVVNPRWRALWKGKKVYDAEGRVALHLVKGGAGGADAEYEVDALSGATLTSNGVTNLIDFWLSEQGFKPFLTRLAEDPASMRAPS